MVDPHLFDSGGGKRSMDDRNVDTGFFEGSDRLPQSRGVRYGKCAGDAPTALLPCPAIASEFGSSGVEFLESGYDIVLKTDDVFREFITKSLWHFVDSEGCKRNPRRSVSELYIYSHTTRTHHIIGATYYPTRFRMMSKRTPGGLLPAPESMTPGLESPPPQEWATVRNVNTHLGNGTRVIQLRRPVASRHLWNFWTTSGVICFFIPLIAATNAFCGTFQYVRSQSQRPSLIDNSQIAH